MSDNETKETQVAEETQNTVATESNNEDRKGRRGQRGEGRRGERRNRREENNGTVGVGYGKSREVPAAIAKGQLDAKKHMFSVPRVRGTITHPVQGHDAAGTVLLRPAAPGTGVIAGGSVRAVMECAGITDVLTKSMGSATAVNVVRATVDALKQLEEPEEIAARRGLALDEVAPDALLRARAAGIAEARKAREEAAAAKAAEEKDGE